MFRFAYMFFSQEERKTNLYGAHVDRAIYEIVPDLNGRMSLQHLARNVDSFLTRMALEMDIM